MKWTEVDKKALHQKAVQNNKKKCTKSQQNKKTKSIIPHIYMRGTEVRLIVNERDKN